MKVLNFSLDRTILEKDSAVQKRLIALAEKAGKITVFVPGMKDEKQELSEHLTVYSFGGSKLLQLFKMWRMGKRLLRSRDSSFFKGGAESLRRRILNPSALQNEPLPLTKRELRPYDLITVQDPYFLGFLAVKLSEKFLVPIEVQIHGFEKMEGGRARLARFVLERAAKIRVVSERLKREITTRYALHATRFYILPVYTQIEISQRIVKRKTVPYPFTFLTVGRLVSVKNIALQINAFAKVAKEIPHIRLRIVGDGPERAKLELEARSLKLEASVVFEGYQNNLGRFYEEADAFLFTSNSEGWGRVVLEAAAHKLPIIMTDVGLAREVIKNEESGLVIPVGDERELTLAMKEFLDKPELRVRLGEAAFKIFKSFPLRDAQIQKQIEEWKHISMV